MSRARLGLTFAVLVLVGCGGGGPPPPIGKELGAGIAAALAAADQARAPWRCAAPDGPTLAPETLATGDHRWKLEGHTLALDPEPARGDRRPFVIGAIADAGGAEPSTIAALGRLHSKLARADLVLALGGMGRTQDELEATLGAIAERAPYPVVALPGDLESTAALSAAVAALRARGAHVLDGRLVQRIEIPGATIAVVPGAGAEGRLVAGAEGCAYRATDVAATYVELTEQPGLRIVASAEAPRISVGGEPSGELALTPSAGHEIDLVVHGPSAASDAAPFAAPRARSGARDACAAAVTPGTADATLRLPGPRRDPTAGLVTIQGASWSWKPIADTE